MSSFNNQAMYHIALTREQGAEYAILTGDPGRVESIALLLDSPEFVASKREYTTWAGSIDGQRVLVTSHGIGGPSTAICVEELALCGVKTMIRVGTCGGMSQAVCSGDLVIANAAIRQEGTSLEYLPVAFPAVSDFEVTSALVKSARDMGERVHVGVVHCKDSFYGQHKPEESPVSYQLQNRWQAWIRGGCLASEMESAALYTVAASKGLKAGCILHVVWNHEREACEHTNTPMHDTTHAAVAAVGALRLLIK
ncbi:MAG: nucleoside phosphorylase [Oscillospiraceae bacterium]|nr:nucleoside phosphorylase [Oscillospiraceae bacterium]MDD3833418.1 nucleoside phosphorylase [Oscillospiraceae bacterium]MDD4546041.1 nucleoside phosphorylase [Oscillospiraceae bacterium]